MELRTLMIICKCASMLTFLCSSWLVHHIASDKRKRSKVYHRLIFGMSCIDIFSFGVMGFVSSWAIPKNTTRPAFQPMGNEFTCNAQGFLVNVGSGSTLYNMCLTIYYLLVIKYKYKEEDFRVVELVMHIVCWGWGLVTGIAGIVLNLFHSATFWCWVSIDDVNVEQPTRGEFEVNMYRWVFLYFPVWVAIISSTVMLAMIFCHIRNIEKETAFVRADTKKTHDMSNDLARQAFLYLLAFLASWLFASITRLIQAISGYNFILKYPRLIVLFVLLTPLTGVFNTLVYTDKEYKSLSKKYPLLTFVEKAGLIFRGDGEEVAERMSREAKTESNERSSETDNAEV